MQVSPRLLLPQLLAPHMQPVPLVQDTTVIDKRPEVAAAFASVAGPTYGQVSATPVTVAYESDELRNLLESPGGSPRQGTSGDVLT